MLTMAKTDFPSTSDCTKAADRLSCFINCASILKYACTVKNPTELEVISKLVMKIGLHCECRKSDLCQCIDYIDALADGLLRPQILEIHNQNCQQFYGQVSGSNFNSNSFSHLKNIAA